MSAAQTGAAVRMFCFAHAGGGSRFYRPWQGGLGRDVEVCPIVLPGRESRVGEQPRTRIDSLIDPLCEAISAAADRPFALFGHSMGALLAYEAARRLSAERHPLLRLFVSGRRAPHLPARHDPLHRLAQAKFLTEVTRLNGTPPEVLAEPELLKLFEPLLRADFELNETYRPLPGPPLDCRVSAFVGHADPEADLEEIAAWRETTSGEFTLRVFHGDHFYLKGTPTGLFAAIEADLRGPGGRSLKGEQHPA
ncbi:MAG: alpha/beta fold hydrolase, partial [Umezawaea sp.]